MPRVSRMEVLNPSFQESPESPSVCLSQARLAYWDWGWPESA
jgi:hypothetical protein